MGRPLAAPLIALLLAACGDGTGILVEVTSSDLSVPADLDVLRFQASSNSARMLDRTFPIDGAWPHSLTIVPASDADADVQITVTGFRGAAFVVQRVVRTSFQRGATRRVEVVLSRDCVGITCPPDVDCLRGMCVGPPPDGDAGMLDGGAPPDAGSEDGGSEDGGSADGGPTDAGAMDAGAGFDAGGAADGGTDAGRDAGRDAGVDAFVPPPDSGPMIPRCTAALGVCVGVLVISELTTEGPGGASDELVEIHNRGSTPVDAGDVTVSYAAQSTSTPSTRATIPAGTMIPPGGYYLLAAAGYTGATTADAGGGWATGFASNRGAVLLEAGSDLLDVVGWRAPGEAQIPRSEGAPIPGATLTGGGSYERKANASSTAASMEGGADASAGNRHDSGDNASDFVQRTARDPQNATSLPEL